MPEFLTAPFATDVAVSPLDIFFRLTVAVLLGCVVAWIYVRTSREQEAGSSFLITLVLLSVLIAMVTQVIGNNVARAFSLVGALSIVRFRTVVRDTRDTAYVIFAVVVGMAAGAANLWVAVIGVAIVGIVSFVIASRSSFAAGLAAPYTLRLRMALGHDLETVAGRTLNHFCVARRLLSVATNRQGAALEFIIETRMRPGSSSEEMVKALNLLEGVQDIRLERYEPERV
jgi:Domain of unknown function (DUF4956)